MTFKINFTAFLFLFLTTAVISTGKAAMINVLLVIGSQKGSTPGNGNRGKSPDARYFGKEIWQ